MPRDKHSADDRVSRLRQENPLPATALPPACYAAAADVKLRRVGKSGAVHISGLPQGVNVKVLTVDQQTYMVSTRPEDEVREMAAKIPPVAMSPFAALSASLHGRKRNMETTRVRGEYTGLAIVPPISDEQVLARADVQRAKRQR
jgi:hypothetical protein